MHQAGVVDRTDAQPHGAFTSNEVDADSTSEIRDLLAALVHSVVHLTTHGTVVPGVTDDGAGDLTITVGLGPRMVAFAGRDLPGAAPLPRFTVTGICPTVSAEAISCWRSRRATPPPERVRDYLELERSELPVRWERGSRGLGNGQPGVARNVIGYLDGVVVPRTPAELDAHVWVESDPPDTARSACCADSSSTSIGSGPRPTNGRTRSSADTAATALRCPVGTDGAGRPDREDSERSVRHPRAAHPSFTGSNLMLRGSYSFTPDRGRGARFSAVSSATWTPSSRLRYDRTRWTT
jgi:dye decolorizing peroxidase